MKLTNATLTQIAAPGPLQGNGDAGEPEPVWEGRAAGYLKRTRRTVVSGGVNVPVRRDVFTILRSQLAPIVAQTGGNWEAYSVVIVDERDSEPVEHRFVVRGMENRAVGGPVDSARLELDPEGEP